VAAQGGFADGEKAAVKLDAPSPSDYPLTIRKVQVHFAGELADEGRMMDTTVRLYSANGTTAVSMQGGAPGTEFWTSQATYQLQAAQMSLNETDVSTEMIPAIVPSGPFWVAIDITQRDSACFPNPPAVECYPGISTDKTV